MKNGFIYEILNTLVSALNYLNLVELFKYVAKRLAQPKTSVEGLMKNANIAIDIYIILKWAVVLFLFVNHISGAIWTILVTYLIWSNFHTYFYYHLWKSDAKVDKDKNRRRFITLIQGISFMNLSFAYLYSTPFVNDYLWLPLSGTTNNISAIIFSFTQSLFVGSETIHAISTNGEFIIMAQTIISFLFIVVLLARTIPKDDNTNH